MYNEEYIDGKRDELFCDIASVQFKLSDREEWHDAEIISKTREGDGVMLIIDIPSLGDGENVVEKIRFADENGNAVGSLPVDISRTATRTVKIIFNFRIKEESER